MTDLQDRDVCRPLPAPVTKAREGCRDPTHRDLPMPKGTLRY